MLCVGGLSRAGSELVTSQNKARIQTALQSTGEELAGQYAQLMLASWVQPHPVFNVIQPSLPAVLSAYLVCSMPAVTTGLCRDSAPLTRPAG